MIPATPVLDQIDMIATFLHQQGYDFGVNPEQAMFAAFTVGTMVTGKVRAAVKAELESLPPELPVVPFIKELKRGVDETLREAVGRGS